MKHKTTRHNEVIVTSGQHKGHYPNLKPLYDAATAPGTPATDSVVSYRSFSRRAKDTRRKTSLAASPLELTGEQLATMLLPADTSLPRAEVIERIERHCVDFDAVPEHYPDGADALIQCTALELASTYANSLTANLTFRCQKPGHGVYTKRLMKLDSCGCVTCERATIAKKRRRPVSDIQKTISEHPGGFEVTGGLAESTSNKSSVTVRCRANGHVFTRPIEEFLEYGRLRFCPLCFPRVGESIVAVVSAYVIVGTTDPTPYRERSPDELQPRTVEGARHRRIRVDVYFENVLGFAGIVVEHHGPQHFEPTRFGNRTPEEAERALEEQKQRDLSLTDVVDASRGELVLVVVPDLNASTNNNLEATETIVACIMQQVPQLAYNSEVLSRCAQLKDPEFQRNLVRQAGVGLGRMQLLRKQLETQQRRFTLLQYDEVADRFEVCCEECKCTWWAKGNNLLASKDGKRRGTGCPRCADRAHGQRRRHSHAELTRISSTFGFRPAFPEGVYRHQYQILSWECVDCTQIHEGSLVSLMRGRMRCHCRSR